MNKPLELKPCPFCGGTARLERPGSVMYTSLVACGSCGCLMYAQDRNGETWNRRAESKE